MDLPSSPISVLLGVGSNLGDRDANISRGLALLGSIPGVETVRESSRFETEPVGGPPQGRYLNAVVELRVTMGPRALLGKLQEIEAALGRVRAERFGPRPLDLDILLYGDIVVSESDLEIPHPRMLERAFVLEPLSEVAPGRNHPLTGRTILYHWLELSARAAQVTGGEGGGA